MHDEDIKRRIASFPRWHYLFDLKGNPTPIFEERFITRHRERERYFFDPLVELAGGSLAGKRVLDLGCNAGYWSLRAIEAGCDYVLGIDGRQMHVDQAEFVFEVKEVDRERYDFTVANIFDLDFARFGSFDVVLCLGLMYHISKHVDLMEQISRVNSDLLVIDTLLSTEPGSFMELRRDRPGEPRDAVDYELVMVPTERAVYELVEQFGYSAATLKPQFESYEASGDYRNGARRAFFCAKETDLSDLPAETEPLGSRNLDGQGRKRARRQARERIRRQAQVDVMSAEVPAETVASPESIRHTPAAGPRSIAFYLPQFHPVPENDVGWGTGFTEWSSVVQAKPAFPGHYQPRLPADLGFYDLRLPEVRHAQADLAREHGIHGFCYYHYWFEGRRLLERPFKEILEAGQPDFPFCLCWANHDWTWRRDGRVRGRLVPQQYDEEDDREHIRWLLDVFQDERYIRVNGRPLFLIYMSQLMPDPARTLTMWREEARKRGVAEPYICKVESRSNFEDPAGFGCDAAVEFWPHGLDNIVERTSGEDFHRENKVFEYRDVVEKLIERPDPPFRRYPCVAPMWDNTPRVKVGGRTLLHGSTPELYEHWLEGAAEKVASNPPEEQLVFINAWNEWAEGAYLEPDIKHGRAYLEATKRAMESSGVQIPAVGGSEEAPPPASAEELYGRLLKKYTLLQQRNMELLNAEELSPLVLQKEEQLDQLRKELRQLKRRGTKQAGGTNGRPKDLDRLVGWMRQVDADVSALLASRRWKMGNTIGEAGRRVLRRPATPTAEDHLSRILGEFRSWLKGSGR